jgi:DNA repair protein RecO
MFTDDALILDSSPFRDRHLLVTMLTRRSGSLRGVLRRARGGKAPQAAAAQILSLVRVTGTVSRQAELATFYQLDLLVSSYPLARDFHRAGAAAVVAELLTTFCPPGEPAPRRFRLGVAVLEALLAGLAPQAAVAYTQFWVLSLSGLLPNPETAGLPDHHRDVLATYRGCHARAAPAAVPSGLAAWLDRLVREESERTLPALDFFRSEQG